MHRSAFSTFALICCLTVDLAAVAAPTARVVESPFPYCVEVDVDAEPGTFLCAYEEKRDEVRLMIVRAGAGKGRNGPQPVRWVLPAGLKDKAIVVKPAKTVANLVDTPITLTVQAAPPGRGTETLQVRGIFALDDGQLLAVPLPVAPQQEVDVMPRLLPAASLVSAMLSGIAICPQVEPSLGKALAPLGPLKPIDSVKVIPFPALGQEQSAGCVLNAFKMVLAFHGRGMTTTEIMTKLGITAADVDQRGGVSWNAYHFLDGDLYTKLGISGHRIVRSADGPVLAWLRDSEAMRSRARMARNGVVESTDHVTNEETIRVPWGVSASGSHARRKHANWLMHALLKVYLSQSRPVVIDLLHDKRQSHVVSVWGYDSEKRGYIINEGFSNTMSLVNGLDIDERWAAFEYGLILVGP